MSDTVSIDLAGLMGRLNTQAVGCLEEAGGWAFNRGNYEVTPAHLMSKMIEDRSSDIPPILAHYEVDSGRLLRLIEDSLERLKTGSGGELSYSPALISLFTDAWLLSSVDFKQDRVRSSVILLTALLSPGKYFSTEVHSLLNKISVDKLREQISNSDLDSEEEKAESAAAGGGAASGDSDGQATGDFLDRFTVDFTQLARDGGIDPVFGRDREIRQMLDILGRRRKNNPIVVGEAGVGKTAVVEGLALRIVQDDIPEFLRGVRLLSLDMGLLQAGASVKGEFEKRLQGVIEDVKGSPTPIVMFIDEAHTLIGAGGQAGGGDAANLLKPALARGELRTIAATTWSEYKKYFEKDPALSRRFQLVHLAEPNDDTAALILRGLRGAYEDSHGVTILDEAVQASAIMASRYISGRQHPDKGVDLLDTASARVKIAQHAKPPRLDDLERKVAALHREIDARERDRGCGVSIDEERLGELKSQLDEVETSRASLEEAWQTEKELAHALIDKRKALSLALEAEAAGETPEADIATLRTEIESATDALNAVVGEEALVPIQVDQQSIATTVSDWTGIPLGNMVSNEAEALLNLETTLKQRIKGQDFAVATVSEAIRAAKSGIEDPETPNGVFLFVGPSGVGKTEMSLAVADVLYGGESSVTILNMSEFQESHTVSRLIGASAGYVGYGEGGVLTEAVRQRPYSVVLFDEVEKGHKQVANIFYQIFDKGNLADGEGRNINFANTTVFLTSNLGTDVFHQKYEGQEEFDMDEVIDSIRPSLKTFFAPALLGRMTIVPFLPLGGDVVSEIVKLKLGKVARRLQATHRMAVEFDPTLISEVTARCTEVESGARNIDHIVRKHIHPIMTRSILEHMVAGQMPDSAALSFDSGEFKVAFSEAGHAIK